MVKNSKIMKKTDLKLIKNNYKRLCEDFKQAKSHNHLKDEDWWVNSPENSNCFWEYIYKNSNNYGMLKELSTQEIANLLGWTTTKTLTELKDALEELKDNLNSDMSIEDLLEFVELSKKFKN